MKTTFALKLSKPIFALEKWKIGFSYDDECFRLAIDSCKNLNGSMIKQHIVNLKMIFSKNHE